MSDRSLNDFLSDADESEPEDTQADDTQPEEPDPPEDTAPESVEPAVATSTLHTDGTPCESCGESVRRRWLDDGAYRCTECKDW
jgi:hypothetical protein